MVINLDEFVSCRSMKKVKMLLKQISNLDDIINELKVWINEHVLSSVDYKIQQCELNDEIEELTDRVSKVNKEIDNLRRDRAAFKTNSPKYLEINVHIRKLREYRVEKNRIIKSKKQKLKNNEKDRTFLLKVQDLLK